MSIPADKLEELAKSIIEKLTPIIKEEIIKTTKTLSPTESVNENIENKYNAISDDYVKLEKDSDVITKDVSKVDENIVTKVFAYGTYRGQMSFGNRHGKGRMEYSSEEYYDGQWKDNNWFGRGLYKCKDFEANGFFGEHYFFNGTIKFTNGDTYEGIASSDRNTFSLEQGTMTYVSGNIYKGQFAYTKRHGEGTMVYKVGGEYKGSWINGLKSGKGTYTYPGGAIYDGEWKYDKRHGQGTHTINSNVQYVGMYENDKRHGKGILTTYTNVYDGNFVNDRPEGKCIFSSQTRVMTGIIKDNYFNGQAHIQWKNAKEPHDNLSYEGIVKENLPDGFGTLVYKDGSKYIGNFYYSNRHGNGKMIYADGTTYDGEWKDNKKKGNNTSTYNENDNAPHLYIDNEVWIADGY
jgi:hypothetical protein